MSSGWSTPSPEEVQIALGALADQNLRHLFFVGLENPQWLEPLAELGAFRADPEVWVDADGIERARAWPEGEYLRRVASERPEDVTDLLLGHSESPNPWVQRVVLDTALVIPVKQAARLVPQIATSLTVASDWVDARQIVDLATGLASDFPRQTRQLLVATFEPKAGDEEVTAFGSRIRVVSSIDTYWYADMAPRAVKLLVGLGMAGLKLAVGWLMRALDIPEGGDDATRYDSSHIWRPSIAPHEQNSGINRVTDVLVDIARDVALLLAQTGKLAEVIEFLMGRERELLARVAVETTARVVATDRSPNAVPLARTLLCDQKLLGLNVRPEYVRLVVSVLPQLDPDDLATWKLLISGDTWQGSDDELRRIASWGDRDAEDVSADEIAAVRRRMTHRLLQPVREVLPPDLTDQLVRLEAEFGAIEHPEFGSFTSSFSGPVSPLDRDALRTMAPEVLLDYLRTWEPLAGHHFGPSREGLARQLEELATEEPARFEQIAADLLGLGRSYVRAIVAGWAKAIVDGFQPTDRTWELLRTLVALPDDGVDVPARFEEDDPVWRWAQRNAVDFAAAYLQALESPIAVADADKVWAVLYPLTQHPDPTPQHEERFGGSNMDSLTLSLNTVRPAAIRASIKLLTHMGAEPTNELNLLRDEVFAMLANRATRAADSSLAVAAVIGEGLGRIWNADPQWVTGRAQELFAVLDPNDDERTHSDVIVSVCLRIYRTSPAFIEMMRPVLSAILSPAYDQLQHTEGWRSDGTTVEAAASHVLVAYVAGLIQEDDPLLATLFAPQRSPEAASKALGTLGWSVMRGQDSGDPADAAAPELLERARGLIDVRVKKIRVGEASAAELSGFYWWVRAAVFPPSWWLPILELANEDPGFNPKGMLGESLARAVESEPSLAMKVLDGLMPSGAGWQRYDLLQHAPHILATALTSGDDLAVERARTLLNRLGREGHLSVLADVDGLVDAAGL